MTSVLEYFVRVGGRKRRIRESVAVLLVVALIAGCEASRPSTSAPEKLAFFQRFTADDQQALENDIRTARAELQAARAKGDRSAALEIAGDLGRLLTTARREQEARALLTAALDEARPLGASETTGWLLMNLAMANQYLHRREEAAKQFPEALEIARSVKSPELEHYTLHHWGRFLAESGDIAKARECFSAALEIRIRLNDPVRQASSRRALKALDALRP